MKKKAQAHNTHSYPLPPLLFNPNPPPLLPPELSLRTTCCLLRGGNAEDRPPPAGLRLKEFLGLLPSLSFGGGVLCPVGRGGGGGGVVLFICPSIVSVNIVGTQG